MGARAAPITRADFLTPPEFADVRLAREGTGRLGGTRVELVRSGDETRLGGFYQQIPLRVMPPFVLDDQPVSLLYLITLTAGLMDGDGHLIELTARRGTRCVVAGQSASRVHPSIGGFATQQWAVEVEDDACLVVLPGPTIPFAGCRFYQRGRVELAPSARLLWGDIWFPGRYERGDLSERFQFKRIVQDFEARRAGRLVYRDRFRWDGPWTPDEAAWHFGGELACASLFVGGPLAGTLADEPVGVRRAVFPLGTGEHCVRWCGPPGAVTADLVEVAMTLAGRWVGGDGASPWLIGSSSLSPSHWFSPVGR